MPRCMLAVKGKGFSDGFILWVLRVEVIFAGEGLDDCGWAGFGVNRGEHPFFFFIATR